MRVLHVINSLIPAGAEMLLRHMAPHFRAAGVDVTIALLKTLDSPPEHELRDAGFPFLPIEGEIYSPGHIGKLARHLDHFDLVHSYLFPAQLWVAAAAALARSAVPLVTTEQNTTNRRRKPWFHPLDRWMYRRYRAIGCCSEGTRASLAEWVPEVSGRLSVIYNGAPIERFRAASPALRSQVLPGREGQFVAAFVARFDPQKDHATLFRAMLQVPQLDVILLGEGASRPDMERLCRTLGISQRVHFLGRRADVPELLKMCDLYIHSANWEGFGIAVVEAMSAGLPVIASDVAGLREVVEGAGVLFPAADDAALVSQITDVLGNRERRAALGEASSRRAAEFSIERAAASWMKLYEDVLRDTSRTSAACAD